MENKHPRMKRSNHW